MNVNLACHELWTSELALAEVRSAILIKERAGLISVCRPETAFARFESLHADEVLRLHPLELARWFNRLPVC